MNNEVFVHPKETITDIVRKTIIEFPSGFVFTPEDFPVAPQKRTSVNRIVNNIVLAGQICRLSKGCFYKPQTNGNNEFLPDKCQIIKDLIEKNGKLIGYLVSPY